MNRCNDLKLKCFSLNLTVEWGAPVWLWTVERAEPAVQVEDVCVRDDEGESIGDEIVQDGSASSLRWH